MRKLAVLFTLLFLSFLAEYRAQVFIMNEDFTDADSITPPMGWSNLVVLGNALYDKWHFENLVTLSEFPLSENAAVFQSSVLSNDSSAETISLETPLLDCSVSSNILLFFDHKIADLGVGATCSIEFFDGFTWQNVISYTASTTGVQSEVINMSALIGGITNAKIRFTWLGNGQGTWMIDNIKVFSPLSLDMNMAGLDSPQRPFQAGNNVPVSITLQNQGIQNITTANIQWTVDGVIQPAYNWSGNLSIGQEVDNIQIGTFAFNDGDVRNLKIWINGINGQTDLNHQNDTLTRKISAGLCGTYTIGGSNPHFENFAEAVEALEVGGVTCPVFFNVRDGVYNEQILINSVAGSSATRWITFKSQSSDNNAAVLNYQDANANDYTLSLSGTSYIKFEDLGILRTNGVSDIVIQNGAHHVMINDCNTGRIEGLDEYSNTDISIIGTNLNGNAIDIRQPVDAVHGSILIQNCLVGDIYINHSGPVNLINNQFASDTTNYSGTYHIEGCDDVVLNDNICRRIDALGSQQILVENNKLRSADYMLNFEGCSGLIVRQNILSSLSGCDSRGIRLIDVVNSISSDNNIAMYGDCGWPIGVHIGGGNSRNVTVRDNTINRSPGYFSDSEDWFVGVYTDGGGDSIYIKSNVINGQTINGLKRGKGIFLGGNYAVLEADSNQISNVQNIGIEISSSWLSNWKVRSNVVSLVREVGLYITGPNAKVMGNKVSRIKAGIGIQLNGENNLVANNFIHAEGAGVAKGLQITGSATNNKVFYNSVYITATNLFTAVGIELAGGSNNLVKYNSIYNAKKGYAIALGSDFIPANNVMDYNNIHTKGQVFGMMGSQPLSTFNDYKIQTGYDANSVSVNPFYQSLFNLKPNHIELNNAALPDTLVTYDIDNLLRGVTPDIGAKEFTPCTNDAGVSEILNLTGAVDVGSQAIQVIIQNHGQSTLNTVQVHWSVNNSAMPTFNWSGTLTSSQTSQVNLGNFNFQSASQYDIRVWTTTPNGVSDCNLYNDTSSVYVATPLCGNYTIGGSNPDFTNFNAAVEALNNAVITCPVVFDVRTGVYNEQAVLYEVAGSSAINTVTFQGEAADSSLAQWRYTALNTENDFTLNLFGSKHIYFQDMTIYRNASTAVKIEGGAEDIHFNHCRLSNVVTLNSSNNKNLFFYGNSFRNLIPNQPNFGVTIANPPGVERGSVVFENNIVSGINISNADSVVLIGNRAALDSLNEDSRTVVGIESSRNLTINNNRFWMLNLNGDTLVNVHHNFIRNGGEGDTRVLGVMGCSEVVANNNVVIMNDGCNTKAVELGSSRNVLFRENNVLSRSGCSNSVGILVSGTPSINVVIEDNSVSRPLDWLGNQPNYGILVSGAGDSIYVHHNIIDGVSENTAGYGISVSGAMNVLQVDSNTVSHIMNAGIELFPASSNNDWLIKSNRIDFVKDNGIIILGHGCLVKDNLITNVKGGNGIVVDADSSLVVNNAIHTVGIGVANGLVIRDEAQGSKVLFNSVQVLSRDMVNAAALRIEAGSNFEIKNNIFSNHGGGYALAIMSPITDMVLNYNDYYSSRNAIIYYLSDEYTSISSFSTLYGWETNGLNYNPFYEADTTLYANHGLLNNVGLSGTGILDDIVGAARGSIPDIGIKEFSLCPKDAGVEAFLGLVNPLPVASQNIQVRLRNHGSTSMTNTVVHWTVNGLEQTPFAWTGNLSSLASVDINIGSVVFESGKAYKFKAWTDDVNGIEDCNHFNDTCSAIDFGTQMCGYYTIGGSNPDFSNFTDASILLNNAGIICPVIFEVRDTIFNEHFFLTQIPGSSPFNTVTFRGESADSSLAGIRYTDPDVASDFTINLIGTDYIHFENMSVQRENGDMAVFVSQGSHDIHFENCRLSKVLSPETSLDTAFYFINNNIEGKDIVIKSPVDSPRGRFVFQGNLLSSIEVNNVGPLVLTDNRGSVVGNAHAVYCTLSSFDNALISGNRFRRMHLSSGTDLNVESNNIYHVEWNYDDQGIKLDNCKNVVLNDNQITMREGYTNRGIELISSRDVVIENNHVMSNEAGNTTSYGILIGSDSREILVDNNQVERNPDQYWSETETFVGIQVTGGDSITITRNNINGLSIATNKKGYGIVLNGVSTTLLCDSNEIGFVQNHGILSDSPNLSNWKITRNTINNVRDNGATLNGRKVRFDSNRIYNTEAGTGIVVNGNQHLVANNFVHAKGSGNAKGISLRAGASNSKIVYNSVSITGTNVINGRGLEILGGNNYLIKDNIFANTGGGYAVYISNMPSQKNFDFNNYFSSGDNFGFYAATSYSQLGQWSAVVNGDVNSLEINPYYESSTSFLPYQKQLNGAGSAAGGILLDIENEIRNQQAPDIGAEEFMVDFGISQLISPTNECEHTDAEEVTIMLRQFGDIPFQNIQLAYTINNGPVQYDLVPGSINNDIEFTFTNTEDLSADGTYFFKIWLVNNGDDNMNNDTLRVLRKTAESPVVAFSYVAGCANVPVVFNATANVINGTIDQYEWNFGAGDSSAILPAQTQYIYPNSLVYYATVRAFSDQACYTEFGDSIYLDETPIAAFTASNHCVGGAMPLINSAETYGAASDFLWDFGDGSSSNLELPAHQYALEGIYDISLIVSNGLGCSDTVLQEVEVYETPQLTLNLLNSYPRNVGNIYLIGEPYGGYFTGNGVMGNIFNPMSIPNQNSTVITYHYTDPETGCSNIINRNVTITPNVSGVAILMQPTSEVACLGNMVILFVQAYGPNIQYQWFKNNVAIPGANQSILVFNSVSFSNQASYKVRVTSGSTVINSSSATIQILSNFSNQYETACDEYTWDLTGETYNESGIYTWVGENSAGCDSTVYLNLTLNKVVLTANVPFTICEGMGVEIDAQNVLDGTVTWPDGTVDNDWATVLLQTSTIYATSLVNGVTCNESISFNVVQHDIPLNFIASDSLGFCGDSAVVTLPSSNYDYDWEHGNFDSVAVMMNSGWYYSSLSNSYCTVYDSVWVELLKADIFTLDTLICENTEASLLVGASNITSLGDLTIFNGDTLLVDGVKSAVVGFNAVGQDLLQVDNTYGFLGGDHVVIINMQGPNSGLFQYNFIQSVAEGQLVMQQALNVDFNSDTVSRAQVLKIQHYDQLTVNGVVTCDPWDGSVGGVIPIYAEEAIVINENGLIEANYKGFAGGAALTAWGVGNQGSSSLSLGTTSYLANGTGGGGGNAEWCHSGQGGGGGGFVFPGDNGGAPCMQCGGGWSMGDCSTSGYGGSAIQNIQGVYLGSGGGAGGQDGDNPDGGGKGGNGGGIVLLHAPIISGGGWVQSIGQNGDDGLGETGGGGGGSGGTIFMYSSNAAVASMVDGGAGGKQGDSRFGGNGSPGLSEIHTFSPVSNVNLQWSTGDTTSSISHLLTNSQWIGLTVSRNGYACQDSVYIQVQPNEIPVAIINQDSIGICGETHLLLTDIVGYGLIWNQSTVADSLEVNSDGWQFVEASEGVCIREDSVWVSFLNPSIQSSATTLCQGQSVFLSNAGNWSSFISDSMSIVSPNWNVNTYTVVNGDSVLGPFANVDLQYSSAVIDHDSLEVSFDIYPHDTWDYSEPFEIYINDVLVATTLFSSNACSNPEFVYQGCANGYCASTGTCYPYYRYSYRWADQLDSVKVRIYQYGGQELCDESWSLDNFNISVYDSKPLTWSNGSTESNTTITADTSVWIYLSMSNSVVSCTDSIYLTVNPVDTVWVSAIVPADSVVVFGTQTITMPGDYVAVFVSISGCDSIVNLHLEHQLVCDVQLTADSICQGSLLGVTANMSGGFSNGYVWSINQVQNVGSISVYPQSDTSYILTVSSGNQMCLDTAFVEVSPATLYYADVDLDGFGSGVSIGFCASPGTGYSLNALDCADNNPQTNPLGTEVCSNGWDDDCLNGDLDCANTGPGIATAISNIGQWGTGVQTNISVNQTLGVNDIQSDGNGVDRWFAFVAQTNAVRIAYRGSLTLGDDNRLMLYDQNDNYAMQWIPLIVEDDVQPGNVGSLNADGGSEVLFFDQLVVGATYYICIQNTNSVYGTGLLTISYLYGSAPDILPYTNYTGIYNNTCQNFKARYRPNAKQYTVYRWASSDITESNPEWAYAIPNTSYSTAGVASTICQMGKISPANLSGATQYLNVTVDVTYQLKDAYGNDNFITGRANAAGLVGLASEQDLYVRSTDQCPVFKSPLFGTIATNRSVCGTRNYQWNFAMQSPSVSLPILINGPLGGSRILNMSTISGVANGQRYDVQIRSNHLDNVSSTSWGSIKCVRTIGSAGMPTIEDEGVIAERSFNGITSSIYPNPNTGNSVVLNVNGMEGELQVKISDATGKLIQRNQMMVEGSLTTNINFDQALSNGLYLVELTNGQQSQTMRMVVNR